jgi:hypothetical protein
LFELRVSPGDRVGPAHHHPARSGVVVTTGESRDKAVALARQVVNDVRIETRPA